ncbi:uncharacterized protein METZ01_LOCUS431548, partial [marine metagenome]
VAKLNWEYVKTIAGINTGLDCLEIVLKFQAVIKSRV